jgi:hypothetical protein
MPFRIIYHFFYRLPVEDLAGEVLRCLEGFAKQRRVTRIPHVQRAAIDDEVIKGFYLRIPESACGFGMIMCHIFKKLENLIGAYVLQLSLRINSSKLVKQGIVALDGPLFVI